MKRLGRERVFCATLFETLPFLKRVLVVMLLNGSYGLPLSTFRRLAPCLETRRHGYSLQPMGQKINPYSPAQTVLPTVLSAHHNLPYFKYHRHRSNEPLAVQ